jgi:hypothetical protein
VLRERLAWTELKVRQELENKEHLDLMELRVHKVLKEIKVFKELRELKVRQEQENKEHQDLTERKEHKELKAIQEHKVLRELRG